MDKKESLIRTLGAFALAALGVANIIATDIVGFNPTTLMTSAVCVGLAVWVSVSWIRDEFE